MSLWRTLSLLAIVPYTPVGIVILVLRFAIYLHAVMASCLLQPCYTIKRLVLTIMSLTLGIWIDVRRPRSLSHNAVVIVSNHVTPFDHLVLHLCLECVTPHSHVFHWGSRLHSESSTPPLDLTNISVKETTTSVHLLGVVQPTGSTGCSTSLKPGFLKSVDLVQPVALEVVRPPVDSWVPHPMHWVLELLWLFFLPVTYFSVRFLDPVSRYNSGETDEAFTDRICQNIVQTLTSNRSKQAATDGDVDVLEAKPFPASVNPLSMEDRSNSSKTSAVCRRNVSETAVARISTFEHLVPVVREVLTDVPVTCIQDALVNFNGDIDDAIDYLLSNNQNTSNLKTPSGDAELLPPSRFNTAADVFYSSSEGRQKSLHERRSALLAYARNRHLMTEEVQST